MGFLCDVGVPLSGIGYGVAAPFLGMVCLRVYPKREDKKILGGIQPTVTGSSNRVHVYTLAGTKSTCHTSTGHGQRKFN